MGPLSIIGRIRWSVVISSLGLMAIGLAAIARGDELAADAGLWSRQIAWILLALAAAAATAAFHYRKLRSVSYPLFFGCLLMLGLVYWTTPKNGAQRWIPLGVVDFQPSELTKLAFIMALANYLIDRKNYRELSGLVVPFLIALVPVGLILREPDLGTSLVFLPVLFSMLFAAGARPRHLALVVCLGVAVSPLLWMGMSAEQKSRVVTLFLQRDGGTAPTGDGYHLHQSKQVLALGGV
jgi:rod shape determining protein RodA